MKKKSKVMGSNGNLKQERKAFVGGENQEMRKAKGNQGQN